MIGDMETGLTKSHISATINEGFTVTTADGRPAHLAVVNGKGEVVEAGDIVAREAWSVCIQTQRNFWKGQGHLRVHSRSAVPLKKAS